MRAVPVAGGMRKMGKAGAVARAAKAMVEALESRTLLSGQPQIVSDLDSGGFISMSNEAALGNTFYFAEWFSAKLWRSDGTYQSTWILGKADGNSTKDLVAADTQLFFRQTNGASGSDLWVTDGTAAGTTKIAATGLASDEGLHTVLGDKLFFVGKDASGKLTPWVSDGTAAGTFALSSVQVNTNVKPVVSGGKVFFASVDQQICSTDGTVEGTRVLWQSPMSRVEELAPLSGGVVVDGNSSQWLCSATGVATQFGWIFSAEDLTSWNGAVYFKGFQGGDIEVWRTDGTTAGTHKLKDINPTGWSGPMHFLPVGDKLYFLADLGNWNYKWWYTDGTTDGTQMAPGQTATISVLINDREVAVVGDYLFFEGETSSSGQELWMLDGATGESWMVADLLPGTNGSSPSAMQNVNGTLYYIANGPSGTRIYSYTPTPRLTAQEAVTLDNPVLIYGQAATFTATLTSQGGDIPSGTVQFVVDGRNAGAPVTVVNGVARYTVTGLSAGGHSISAVYSGDSSFKPATSEVLTQQVDKAAQAISWSNPADIVYGTALGSTQLSATVSGIQGGSTPGALTYSPAAGTILNAGQGQVLTVTAAETANYAQATQTVVINVAKATTTTMVTSSVATSTFLTPVTFAATVDSAAGRATGSVQFVIDGSPVGIPVVLSNGKASFTIPGLVVGQHAVMAQYLGDGNYIASTGSGAVQSVDSLSLSVPETTAGGSVVGTLGSFGTGANNYRITGGSGAELFALDPASGVFTLKDGVHLDYESQNRSYVLYVQVADSSSPAVSIDGRVDIVVADVNESPVVNAATFTIPEKSSGIVGQVTGLDPDAGRAGALTWSIASQSAPGAFVIDPVTGVLSIASPNALDFEAHPQITLTVQASDGGSPSLAASNTVTVNLTDVGEAPTAITLSSSLITEATRPGQVIEIFAVTDPDAGDVISVSLVPGAADNALFTVDGNQLKAASWFTRVGRAYTVRVAAVDSYGLKLEESISLMVVRDSESAAFGQVGARNTRLTLQDADGDSIEYSLTGGGIGMFVGTTSRTLLLTGTTLGSSLSVRVVRRGVGGDGKTQLAAISSDGLLKSIKAPCITVGDIGLNRMHYTTNAAVVFALGAVENGSIDASGMSITSLSLDRWISTDGQTHSLIASSLGTMSVTGKQGDLQADLEVGSVTKSIKVAGVFSGDLDAAGDVASLTAGKIAGQLHARSFGAITTLRSRTNLAANGDASGEIYATGAGRLGYGVGTLSVAGSTSGLSVRCDQGNINKVVVSGDGDGLDLRAVGSVGTIQVKGYLDAQSRIQTTGGVKAVSLGALFNSDILVGVSTEVTGDLAQEGDFVRTNGAFATLGSLTITGTMRGVSPPRYIQNANVSAPLVGKVSLVNLADHSTMKLAILDTQGASARVAYKDTAAPGENWIWPSIKPAAGGFSDKLITLLHS